MKRAIYFLAIITSLILTSCVKGYTHEKVVTNNSREVVTVISGCCDRTETYVIQPEESEVVFACFYQTVSKPTSDELSWQFQLIQEGESYDLSSPNQWANKEKGRILKYEYVVND